MSNFRSLSLDKIINAIHRDRKTYDRYVEIKARANAPFFIDYNDDTADFDDFIKAVASYVYDDCIEHATQLVEDAEANELTSAWILTNL